VRGGSSEPKRTPLDLPLIYDAVITDHFVVQVEQSFGCVCVFRSDWTTVFKRSASPSRCSARWFIVTLPRSSSMVKVNGQKFKVAGKIQTAKGIFGYACTL